MGDAELLRYIGGTTEQPFDPPLVCGGALRSRRLPPRSTSPCGTDPTDDEIACEPY